MAVWVVLMMAVLVGRPLWLARGAPWGLVGLVGLVGIALFAAVETSTVLHRTAGQARAWYSQALWATLIGVAVHQVFRKGWSQWLQGICILRFFGFSISL